LTKNIEIEIYGHRYTIKGDAEEDYIKRLAAYVDEQMRGVAQGMKTATFASWRCWRRSTSPINSFRPSSFGDKAKWTSSGGRVA